MKLSVSPRVLLRHSHIILAYKHALFSQLRNALCAADKYAPQNCSECKLLEQRGRKGSVNMKDSQQYFRAPYAIYAKQCMTTSHNLTSQVPFAPTWLKEYCVSEGQFIFQSVKCNAKDRV